MERARDTLAEHSTDAEPHSSQTATTLLLPSSSEIPNPRRTENEEDLAPEFVQSVAVELPNSLAAVLHLPLHLNDPVSFSATESNAARYVHPSARKLFRGKMHCLRFIPVLGSAVECYGPRLVFTLTGVYFLFKGIAYQTLTHSLFPMFHDRFKSTALEFQRYRTVSTMGWSMKPFTALISDAFALWGYKKRWILTFSAAFGAVCSIGFALLPAQQSAASAAASLSFLIGFGQANLDILLEGLYARKIAGQPSGGPSIVSAVWVAQMSAGMLAAVIQGPLSDAGLSWVGNLVGGGCMAACVPFLWLNFVEEDKNRVERWADEVKRRLGENRDVENSQPMTSTMIAEEEVEFAATVLSAAERKKDRSEGNNEQDNHLDLCRQKEEHYVRPVFSTRPERDHEALGSREHEELDIPTYCGGAIEFNKGVLVRNYRITASSVLMTTIVVGMAIITTLYGGFPLLAVVLVGTLLMTSLIFWALPLVVAKAGLFACLYQGCYVILTSPLDAFYLADEKCLPDGPHFSYFFYNTISGVIGNFAGLIGVVAFTYIFSKHSYRLTFIVTVVAEILASMFDLIIVRRWNTQIGIPDHYMYLFGDAVVYQVAYMLSWMPLFLLLAQLCPHGSESMVFALLVSFFNHGRIISGAVGALLMEWVWPVVSDGEAGGPCDFSHLWKLVLVGHMLLPLLIIFSVFLLIPSARVCDELDHMGHPVARSSEKQNHSTTRTSYWTPEQNNGELIV